jgi:hypothetical protein
MAGSDFNIVLKKEAKTSLQAFKDQSLLRRRFGDSAVALYNAIDSGEPASKLMQKLGIVEEAFVEILEFMNNNAMVSVMQGEPPSAPVPQEIEVEPEPQPEAAIEKEALQIAQKKPARQFDKGNDSDNRALSPLEKILFDTYGELGVRVYNLIDGEKTAEEILRETGMSEAKLVEILEFMDERGIIKLEKPLEASQSGGDDEGDTDESSEEEEKESAKPAREPRFTPIAEDAPEGKPFSPPAVPVKQKEEKKQVEIPEEPGEDIVLVDVPAMEKITMMQRALIYADLSTKFDRRASELMKLVDGNRDFVELAMATGMALHEIDAVMAHFGTKGILSFRQLERNDIKKRYGEDGFSIYKKYGRDGLLLYEMIGKEASLKDIILKSRVDPERAIDIFMFIHRVLGLEIPIDRDIIYRQIGMKK